MGLRLLGRTNGWQRIGVILSVVWAVYIVVSAINEYNQPANFSGELQGACPTLSVQTYVRWYDEKTGATISSFRNGERSLDCDVAAERAKSLLAQQARGTILPARAIKFGQVIMSVLVPVAVSWVFVYLLIWLFKWVRAGFRGNG